MRARIARILTSVPFLAAAGAFAAYLAFGFFLVDPLAQKLLPWIGEKQLDSRLRAERIQFNPLTLELTATGLALAEKNGAPLAGIDRLYVNLDARGVFRWAWRIRDLRLDRPRATLEIRPGGDLNWDALLARLNADRKPPSDTMVRLLVDHVRIADGDIHYTDADRPGEPFVAVLEPLGIELDGLSTLPADRGDYLVVAKLPEQGGTLRWKGDVGLNPVASRGEIGLEGVQLANLLRVVRSPRNFEVPSGTLAAQLAYRFAMVRDERVPDDGTAAAPADRPWLQISGANLAVRDVVIAPRSDAAAASPPALRLAHAHIGDARFDLAGRTLEIPVLEALGGRIAAVRDAAGVLDWRTLFASEAAVTPPAPAGAESAGKTGVQAEPWRIDVREIRFADWSARFTDRRFARPLIVEAEGLGLRATAAVETGAATSVVLGPLNASSGPVQLHSGEAAVAALERVTLVNAAWARKDGLLTADALNLSGMRTEASFDANRRLNWADILQRVPGAVSVQSPPDAQPADEAPMTLRLARLALDGIAIGVVDRAPSRPVRLDIADGFVTARDLSLDLERAVPIEAGFTLRQGGRFSARGTVRPGRSAGALDLRVGGLSLKPFASYVNRFARLELHSGTASTRGTLTFEPGKSGVSLNFDGGVAVDELAITEEDTGDAFLGWKKLSSDSLHLALAPDRLHVNELVALDPFGKIIIFEDKSINLRRVLRAEPAAEPAAEPGRAAIAVAPVQPDEPPAFPLAVERLRIVGGNLEFADLSLTPQFGTRIHDLGGVVSGLSTDPTTTAQVELDGKVDAYGSARTRGAIQPFRAADFTDLTLAFRNLEMTHLTPYSGKFAGRRIESGKLSADLQYKVEDRKLAGENTFIVNTLRLGERVESPDATNLPLDLAIALLEDGNGVINLDLPVSGSLDDPEFGYGRIVWKAFVNVLTKLVTAPFRALGKLLGVESERLESIDFDPGSSALLPPEQEKLKTVAAALAQRPALELVLQPGYGPEADRRALQERAMRVQAAAVAGIALAAGEAPGPVDVNNYKIRRWLEDRYIETAGRDDYKALRAGFEDRSAGSVLGEQLVSSFRTRDEGPASAFHAELLERLTRRWPVDEGELLALAEARGQAMRQGLLAQGLGSGRIRIEAPASRAAEGALVGSRLTLAAAARAAAPAAVPPASR